MNEKSAELLDRRSTAYILAIVAVIGLVVFFVGAGPGLEGNGGDPSVSTSEMQFLPTMAGGIMQLSPVRLL